MVGDGALADYELLIVDDASTDRTPELAAEATAGRRQALTISDGTLFA